MASSHMGYPLRKFTADSIVTGATCWQWWTSEHFAIIAGCICRSIDSNSIYRGAHGYIVFYSFATTQVSNAYYQNNWLEKGFNNRSVLGHFGCYNSLPAYKVWKVCVRLRCPHVKWPQMKLLQWVKIYMHWSVVKHSRWRILGKVRSNYDAIRGLSPFFLGGILSGNAFNISGQYLWFKLLQLVYALTSSCAWIQRDKIHANSPG